MFLFTFLALLIVYMYFPIFQSLESIYPREEFTREFTQVLFDDKDFDGLLLHTLLFMMIYHP